MNCAIGDVVLVPIPFTDLSSRKVRPAIIVGHSSHPGDLFVVPISSQLANVEFELHDWKKSGLNVRCGVKSQISTIEFRIVLKVLGRLSGRDASALTQSLRGWLKL